MIERSKTKSKYSKRDRADRVNKKRRLTMEGLESRQLLAAEVFLPDVNVPVYSQPRNVGTVQSLQMFESENVGQSGLNDYFNNADFIPLGNGPGQQDTIDLTGSMAYNVNPTDPFSFTVDIDTFAFDLKAGDILDIATFGTAGTIDVFYENGFRWYGTDLNQGLRYPADSPLQTVGNAVAAQVVPEDGRYYLTVSPIDTQSNYTLGLRTYRPVVEELPIGAQQVIFIDFDGGFYPRTIFDNSGVPQPGVIRVPSLQESLPFLGIQIQDTQALNELIDKTIAEVDRQFAYLGVNGNAGDYNSTGNIGDYGVTILNSRDHADPGNHPLVTRVLVGGDSVNAEVPQGVLGVSSTLDVGNFSMDDIVFALLEPILPAPVPIAPAASELDFAADIIALVISHEAVHSFGMRHTDENNGIPTIVDAVVNTTEGPDGIYGTLDDTRIDFVDDQFRPIEGFFGIYRTTDSLANTLRTGRIGGGVTGTIFSDLNRDGRLGNEPGLPAFTVFADINGNGQLDATEPATLSDLQGRYSLSVRPGTYNILAVPRDGYAPTTANPVTTSITTGRTNSGVNFGFNQVIPNITGTAYVDSNGNAIRDTGEVGLEGAYIYIDLDGDDRPDLGEPGTNTASDGTYSLNFPGPGIYTLRSDLKPGFERTFPEDGEHLVVYNGISLTDNYDFGFLPSQDFGDAPDSYGTTVAADGARHGIVSGLTIGAIVDRESQGFPSSAADGDDANNLDDEDGVRLTSPLGPGASATFEVTVNNTTGSNAFLQAFMDFNRDGVFGPGEQFADDILVRAGTVAGTQIVTVNVPAGVTPGTTYTRFRLSQTSGIGATGFAKSGEVEDYSFPILNAAKVANDDEFSVSRNTLSNVLDVLANDFQTVDNPLTIDSVNTTGTAGVVVNGGDKVFYTPPNGYIGRDVFSYTVVDSFGIRSTASVVVNVNFQSNVPIAVDDVFEVPQGSSNRALNVLDNDVASIFGGLTITSVGPGSAGGTVTIVGGGQSIRYTPLPGFAGTEQFIYSIQDAAGSASSATVTVNLLPGSLADDVVDFSIEVLDPINNRPVSNVQVGDDILVRVSVDDLRLFASPQGVASAFLDLLYTDELVSTLDTDNNPNFPFDISFGPLFSGINVLQRGDALVPGLINEVGGVQRIDDQQEHTSPVELFTLRMRAVSPGVAVFQADPADEPISETVVLGSDIALTPSQLRLGNTELTILPDSDIFTAAVDDSFPSGRDSDGNLITNASINRNRLDVLDNDNLGPTGVVREFGLVTSPSLGNAFIDDNGTPGNLNDDFISYRANANANGLETFTYLIVTDDNVRSTAEVTIALGNQNANSIVAFDFNLVSGDGSGTPINSVSVGDRFGVEIYVEDLRSISTFVFAGYLDVLYDTGFIAPADTRPGDEFDFDVDFGPEYVTDAAVGTAATPGIIDEFGTLFARASVPPDEFDELNPGLLATIYFNAIGVGTTSVVGSPADASPFQDTLLFGEDNPIDRSLLRFESLQITVGGGAPLQNQRLPQDVNNDGQVSPIDALLIINQMNRADLTGEGEAVGGGQTQPKYYTDVNGDNLTTALDALQVINYLKRMFDSQGNGEQVILVSNDPLPSQASEQSADDVFATLATEDSETLVSTDAPVSSGTQAVSLASSSADTDDEEDDVLSLLADDVSGLWS
jgi:hypothetical protein